MRNTQKIRNIQEKEIENTQDSSTRRDFFRFTHVQMKTTIMHDEIISVEKKQIVNKNRDRSRECSRDRDREEKDVEKRERERRERKQAMSK
jgi:hypothetical protein